MVWLGVGSFVFPDFRNYLRPWPMHYEPPNAANVSIGGRPHDSTTFVRPATYSLTNLVSGSAAVSPTELPKDIPAIHGAVYQTPPIIINLPALQPTAASSSTWVASAPEFHRDDRSQLRKLIDSAGPVVAGIGGIAAIGAAVVMGSPILAIAGVGLCLLSLFSW